MGPESPTWSGADPVPSRRGWLSALCREVPGNWYRRAHRSKLRGMTVSRLRVAKSETRNMAEHDRVMRALETSEWQMSNATFFTAFVVIAALLAGIALLLR